MPVPTYQSLAEEIEGVPDLGIYLQDRLRELPQQTGRPVVLYAGRNPDSSPQTTPFPSPEDMVVLSENPLKVDPLKIKDIQVLETIKEGFTQYKRGEPRAAVPE